jgi:hypothetical protein
MTAVVLMMLMAGQAAVQPVQMDWSYGNLVASEAKVEPCLSDGDWFLMVEVDQVATATMSDEEKNQHVAAVKRFEDSREAAADWRSRLRVWIAYRQEGGLSDHQRVIRRTWFWIRGNRVSWLEVFDTAEGGSLFRIADEVTGESIQIVSRPASPEEWSENHRAIRTMISAEYPVEREAAVMKMKSHLEDVHECTVEVNGLVRYLDSDTDDDLRSAVTRTVQQLWAEAGDSPGLERISAAVALGFGVMPNQPGFEGRHPGTKSTPLDPTGLGSRHMLECRPLFADVVQSDDRPPFLLSPLPEDIVEKAFGESGLPTIDPDWDFEKVVARSR